MRLAVLLSVSFILVACAGKQASAPAASDGKTVSFDLPDPKGDQVHFSDFRGRPVILDFWASWCEPCKTAMPFFDELQARYGSRVVIIGVNVDESAEAMLDALAQRPVRFTIVHDSKGELARDLDVQTMPSTYIVNGKGQVQTVHRGFVNSDRSEIEVEIEKLLAEGPGP